MDDKDMFIQGKMALLSMVVQKKVVFPPMVYQNIWEFLVHAFHMLIESAFSEVFRKSYFIWKEYFK